MVRVIVLLPSRKLKIICSRDVKTVRLSGLPVRSKDALQVHVDATFQYRLKIVLGELVDLYYKWGTAY